MFVGSTESELVTGAPELDPTPFLESLGREVSCLVSIKRDMAFQSLPNLRLAFLNQ